MITYKFINDNIVAKIDDDGISRSSCLTANPEYQAWLAIEGNVTEPADVPSLASVKASAYTKIDGEAYKTRLRFITPNKDSTYLAKSIQVDAYIAAGYPTTLTNYGYIKAEVARLGLDVNIEADLHTAADGLVVIRNQWLYVDSLIEEVALTAKASVNSAADSIEIEGIVNSTVASFEGIN